MKSNFPGRRQRLVLFLFILIVKSATVLYLSHLTQCDTPSLALGKFSFASGDTPSYTGAMENYVQYGTYYFFNGEENVYAGRLPHYSITYLFFRQFFPPATAADAQVIFQIILEACGIFALCLLAFQYFGKWGFYSILLFLIITTNWSSLSFYISPESLSISALVLCLWQWQRYRNMNNLRMLIYSGFFFGWLVTLKAYYILLIIPIGIELLLSLSKKDNYYVFVKQVLLPVVLFTLPLCLMLTPWIIRNYNRYDKFIPLQINEYAGYPYSQSELASRKFIAAWGGDFIHWEKTSAGCYFHPTPEIPCTFKFPEYVFSSNLQRGDVDTVRSAYIELLHRYDSVKDMTVKTSFDRLTETYRNERPLRYYVISPALLCIRFLKHSGSYYLPIHGKNPCYASWQLLIKLTQSLMYWIALVIGLPGIIALGFYTKKIILPFLPIFLIMLFPLFFSATEWRYFRTIEPMLYLGVVFAILKTGQIVFKKKLI